MVQKVFTAVCVATMILGVILTAGCGQKADSSGNSASANGPNQSAVPVNSAGPSPKAIPSPMNPQAEVNGIQNAKNMPPQMKQQLTQILQQQQNGPSPATH